MTKRVQVLTYAGLRSSDGNVNNGIRQGVIFSDFPDRTTQIRDQIGGRDVFLQPLEPKIPHIFQGVKVEELRGVSPSWFKEHGAEEYNLCSLVDLDQASPPDELHRTAMSGSVHGNNGNTWLEVSVAGDLKGIEADLVHNMRRFGERRRGVESLVQRVASYTSARKDLNYLTLRGSVTYDKANNIVYLVANPESGRGKTSLALQLFTQEPDNMEFVTNQARFKISPESITLLPQHYPIDQVAKVRIKRPRYEDIRLAIGSLGIKMYDTKTSEAPIGGEGENELVLLEVPTRKEPLLIDQNMLVILLSPYATPATQVSIAETPNPAKLVRDAWRATWSLREVYDWFTPSTQDETQLDSAFTRFGRAIDQDILVHRIANRLNHALEVGGPHKDILTKVRDYTRARSVSERSAEE